MCRWRCEITYQFQNLDDTEPVSDTDGELKANAKQYYVLTGCGYTLDTGDLTVDVAAGTIVLNGVPIVVAAQTDAVTLVADGTNPRFSWVAIASDGLVDLVSGDAATDPVVPELGDRVAIALIRIPAAETLASNCTDIDKRVPGEPIQSGPLIPETPGADAYATLQLNSNTTQHVGRIILPHPKTISSVSVEATAAGAAGTIGVAILSEDGQTIYVNLTTASISGAGLVTTALATAVTLPAGVYYVAVNPDSTADVTIRAMSYSAGPGSIAAPAGDNELSGSVTVTASTIEAFDPDADVTFAAGSTAAIRLD